MTIHQMNIYSNGKKISANIKVGGDGWTCLTLEDLKLIDKKNYNDLENILTLGNKFEIEFVLSSGEKLKKYKIENLKINYIKIEENNVDSILSIFFSLYIKNIMKPIFTLRSNTFYVENLLTNNKATREDLLNNFKHGEFKFSRDIEILKNPLDIQSEKIIVLENINEIKKQVI